MSFFNLNLYGFVFLFGSALIMLILQAIIPSLTEPIAVVGGGTLMLLADLGWRGRRGDVAGRSRWLSRQAGGFVALGPAWVIGLILIIVGALAHAGLVDLTT